MAKAKLLFQMETWASSVPSLIPVASTGPTAKAVSVAMARTSAILEMNATRDTKNAMTTVSTMTILTVLAVTTVTKHKKMLLHGHGHRSQSTDSIN